MKRLVIVSGRSGSGKSISLHVLEDLGFYCIDNLPISLLPSLVDHVSEQHQNLAVGIDARNIEADLIHFDTLLEKTVRPNVSLEVVYLDANNKTLLQRFSETRRKHPLSNDATPLQDALDQEKRLLEPVADCADLCIDTSRLTMHQLRDVLYKQLRKDNPQELSLLFQSFGYKHGIPIDTDYVFDVRCLPNPYWETHLRAKTGLDPSVADYLEKQPITKELLADIQKFLETWIPRFIADNRSYMTIAIGCTGGQHRSVFVSEQLAAIFRKLASPELTTHIQVRHRELL